MAALRESNWAYIRQTQDAAEAIGGEPGVNELLVKYAGHTAFIMESLGASMRPDPHTSLWRRAQDRLPSDAVRTSPVSVPLNHVECPEFVIGSERVKRSAGAESGLRYYIREIERDFPEFPAEVWPKYYPNPGPYDVSIPARQYSPKRLASPEAVDSAWQRLIGYGSMLSCFATAVNMKLTDRDPNAKPVVALPLVVPIY
jgi:hypothetical protein